MLRISIDAATYNRRLAPFFPTNLYLHLDRTTLAYQMECGNESCLCTAARIRTEGYAPPSNVACYLSTMNVVRSNPVLPFAGSKA